MAGPNPFLTGLACRCPACGEGPLFDGFLRVGERCESCGLDMRAADSGDGPAVFIVLIVGAIACAGALVTEAAYHPPVWVHLVLWLPLTAILTAILIRPFKGVLLAMQFHHKASEARHDGRG